MCRFDGFAKIDMTAAEGKGLAATLRLPPGHAVGEPFFVPRDADALCASVTASATNGGSSANGKGEVEQDDGWLIAFVNETATRKASCMVRYSAVMQLDRAACVGSTPYSKHWCVCGNSPPRQHLLLITRYQAPMPVQQPAIICLILQHRLYATNTKCRSQ